MLVTFLPFSTALVIFKAPKRNKKKKKNNNNKYHNNNMEPPCKAATTPQDLNYKPRDPREGEKSEKCSGKRKR